MGRGKEIRDSHGYNQRKKLNYKLQYENKPAVTPKFLKQKSIAPQEREILKLLLEQALQISQILLSTIEGVLSVFCETLNKPTGIGKCSCVFLHELQVILRWTQII